MEIFIDEGRWREIDFESNLYHNKYEVSHLGRIKSCAIDLINGRILKDGLVNGYRCITIKFGEHITIHFSMHKPRDFIYCALHLKIQHIVQGKQ